MSFPRRCFSRGRVLVLVFAFVAVVAFMWFGLSLTNFGQALMRVYAPALAPVPGASRQSQRPLPEFEFSVQSTPLSWIEPGTLLENGHPAGWTRLVIKNNMKIVAGATGAQARSWNELLSSFSLAVTARVAQSPNEQSQYVLEEVAMGWCREIGTASTVISSGTHQQLKAELTAMEAILLAMQELDCEQNIRVIARSAITMFYDVERHFVFDGQHKLATIRHAILVNPRTGSLSAFLWIVSPAENLSDGGQAIELLPNDFVTTFELRLKPAEGRILALPAPEDFAIMRLPSGHDQLPIDAALAELAFASSFTPQSARQLEKRLQHRLGWK